MTQTPVAKAGVVSDSIDGNATKFRKAPVEVSNAVSNLSKGDETANANAEAATQGDEDNTSATPNEAQIPKALRGKSLDEVYNIYRASQSEVGRLRNEVGQTRYVVDQLLQVNRQDSGASAQPKAKPEPVTSERLLTDPENVISSVAERAAKKATESTDDRIARLEFEAQRERFVSRFPKYEETMGDEGFLEWVKDSPYRQRLAVQASQHASFEAAGELFGLYEETEKVRNATVTSNQKPSNEGQLVRPGNGNTTGGAQKQTTSQARQGGKKVWARSELAQLYITNRDSYNAQADEIRQAYREGRVR